jgi:hypothetical protein
VPNFLLGYRSPQEVKDCCKKIIDTVAADGGYILDASAIVQNDAKVENIRAMTDFVREYGVYGGGHLPATPPKPPAPKDAACRGAHYDLIKPAMAPGVCIPWAEKLKELPPITGDADLCRQVWENVDFLGYLYIWHCLLSF